MCCKHVVGKFIFIVAIFASRNLISYKVKFIQCQQQVVEFSVIACNFDGCEVINSQFYVEFYSQVLLVRKQDKSFRLCTDYRQLNKLTMGYSWPLPDIKFWLQQVKTCIVSWSEDYQGA